MDAEMVDFTTLLDSVFDLDSFKDDIGNFKGGTEDRDHPLAAATPFCAPSAAGDADAVACVAEPSSSVCSSNSIGAGSAPPSGAASSGARPRANHPANQESLQKLIESVKAPPHTFTIETNNRCMLIMNHPELDLWGSSDALLQCYESYNGKDFVS